MIYLAFLPFQLERYLGWVRGLNFGVLVHILISSLTSRLRFLVRGLIMFVRRKRILTKALGGTAMFIGKRSISGSVLRLQQLTKLDSFFHVSRLPWRCVPSLCARL